MGIFRRARAGLGTCLPVRHAVPEQSGGEGGSTPEELVKCCRRSGSQGSLPSAMEGLVTRVVAGHGSQTAPRTVWSAM